MDFSIMKLAENISTPLMLGALIALILFFILKQLLAKNIFPTLTKANSFIVIKTIIDRLFWLSLIAAIFGFTAYIYPIINPPAPKPSQYTEAEQSILKLEEKANMLSNHAKVIRNFSPTESRTSNTVSLRMA